jgi:esterase
MEVLHSKVIGEGEPLIILHGYFGMGDNWKSQATKLAETYQVHILDQRNHGRSFHADDFDYEVLADDLDFYYKNHNLDSAYLLGHSMGGKTAMLYAVTRPEKVKKMIIADIAPKYYPPHHDEILRALNAVNFSQISLRTEVDVVLKKYIKEEGIRQFLLKNVYRKTKNNLDFRFHLESLTDNNREVGAALPAYTEYEGAVLFLRGASSNYILKEDEVLIQAHFPKALVKTISNAGHWLHAENPNDFLNEVLGFLVNV